MNLKRILTALCAATILAAGGTTAFAHHGGGCHGSRGGSYARPSVTYQACPYDDCDAAETHTHGNDGCYYYGHYEGDGHTHCAPSGGYSGGYCHNHL